MQLKRLKFSGRPRGYTIVEVLLVIAVSTFLFLAVVRLFSGQQGENQFTQAMQDLRSKIQSLAIEVTSGVPPDISGYTCSISGASQRPVFQSGGASNQDCVFLGRALMVTPGSVSSTADTLFIYTVFGDRNKQPGNTEPATTLNQANPEIAHDNASPPNYLFNDTYILGGRARVLSDKFFSNGPDSGSRADLIGLYTSLSSTAAAPAPETPPELISKAYETSANLNPSGDPVSCVESSSPCGNVVDFNSWVLCIQSGFGSRTAQMTVDTTSTGVKIRISYITCS